MTGMDDYDDPDHTSQVYGFIPVKADSTRVRFKNLRIWRGRPLYQWIILHALEANCFQRIVVQTDADEIADFALKIGCCHLDLPDGLRDNGNGNDLLVHQAQAHPEADLLFQLFATAPELRPQTIAKCVSVMHEDQTADSVFTATMEKGWYWLDELPVNFRPGVLPRSQDAPRLTKETTGLYGIRRAALLRYHCRIGATPAIVFVDPPEMVDLDEERDFE